MSYLGFLGGGNMAEAIIGGLIDNGTDPETLIVAEPLEQRRAELESLFPGCRSNASNALVASQSSQLLLAVKPQVMPAVCREIAEAVQAKRPMVISIAAGVRCDDLSGWLGGDLCIVRAMPNQPALLRQGITGLYANDRCTGEEVARAGEILAAVGDVVTVHDEPLIDAVTAVSGSGPAYVYLLMQMMSDAGVELGLDASISRALAIKTATGAASLAAASDETMAELIERVRSPGGTTAAALDRLEADDVRAIFARALTAARDRATELADQSHQEK
ncbi:MAG: pyrroline-5-carboxylate reductase [Pseudomonadota bacterium]